MNVTKKIMKLKIGQIKRDPKFQTRKVSDYRVRKILELIESGFFPAPVQVVMINDIYFLIDGWHRLAAWETALPEGGEIPIELVEGLKNHNEMRIYAALQNDHGWPYTEAEKRSLLNSFTNDGIEKRQAMSALKISDLQLRKWDWKVGDVEFVTRGKDLKEEERAENQDKTTISERATESEKTIEKERSRACEETILPERAKPVEETNEYERVDGVPALYYMRRLTEWIRAGKVTMSEEKIPAVTDLLAELNKLIGEN